ncbi:ABC transporter ATP-binding protein [Kosakonia cowanii]|uniref:ABC transporter ATP-binding protein n=1 Tax=Kosakonia cowanii TaxID=208223 RepID=UPI000B96C464|nr:ABC transporter ATP-binding protein [Kosakonia cowanii]AST69734.1 ABC transporter ATP-binding protein [Kosakonia cowanii]
MADLLQIQNLSVHYGGIQAVHGIDFALQEGERGTLVGANGAGKSSTVRAISGLQAFSGDILWRGRTLRGRRPDDLLRDGIVLVPEGRGVFARMTVQENLQMGAWARRDSTAVKQETAGLLARFPRLAERQHQLAGLLSGGEQQLLALSRALLSQPRLLILDEPSMGLAPIMVETIFQVIDSLRDAGVTLLLIEQNARLALEVTDSAWVMDSGAIVHRGRSAELLADNSIQQIYLGELPNSPPTQHQGK